MSDYLQPARGDWVTFHPNTPGSAEIGQVAKNLEPNQWGRARYQIHYWIERTTGKTQRVDQQSTEITADRLIAITHQPTAMSPLITPRPKGRS